MARSPLGISQKQRAVMCIYAALSFRPRADKLHPNRAGNVEKIKQIHRRLISKSTRATDRSGEKAARRFLY